MYIFTYLVYERSEKTHGKSLGQIFPTFSHIIAKLFTHNVTGGQLHVEVVQICPNRGFTQLYHFSKLPFVASDARAKNIYVRQQIGLKCILLNFSMQFRTTNIRDESTVHN